MTFGSPILETKINMLNQPHKHIFSVTMFSNIQF